MFAKERQDKIYEMILKNNAVTVSNLVETFAVSIETIRRDLLEMEKAGLLNRVHGGAVAKNEMKQFSDLPQRNLQHSPEKKELSLKACEFINEGDIIAVDTGSTAIFFAEALKESFTKLTVITHSLDVFNILNGQNGFEVILCGGHFIKEENSFYGPLVKNTLSNLHADKAFIFTTAVSLEHGVCDYRNEFYEVQKAMLNCSDNIFILADSSKFEKKALLKLCDMRNDYIYITDSALPRELKELYKENNIKIYTK